MPSILNIVAGMRFGRLVIIERAVVPTARNVMWKCQCDCGNITVAAAANLGRTKFSCGCFRKEKGAASLRGNTYQRTHNRSHTPEYTTWSAMKDRCNNPNNKKYERYGKRGIKVCQQWLVSFETFLADMGTKPTSAHTIEREDNDGNYTPENCIWATKSQQARNRRNNRRITIDGQTMLIVEWREYLKIPKWKVHEMTRTRDGRPAAFATVEDALRHLYTKHAKSSQA